MDFDASPPASAAVPAGANGRGTWGGADRRDVDIGDVLPVADERRHPPEGREVLDASAQAVARARALEETLRRVAGTLSTPEARAVQLVEAALAESGALIAVAYRLTDTEDALESVGGVTRRSGGPVPGESRLPLDAGWTVCEAVRTGRVVHCETRAELCARYPAACAAAEQLGVHAVAAVPARHLGGIHGALLLGWAAPRRLMPIEQVMLRTAAGRLARALAHARLYYGERAAHAAADEARREAERAREDAERQRRAAEEASRAKDDFLAVVSHELRTPLQAILGFSDLLGAEIAGPLAPRQHDYVRRVQAAGGQLLDTIENLLGFARAQAGKEVVVAAPFDAAMTVAQVLEMAAPLAERKGLTLRQAGAPEGALAIGDEKKVRQILTNLVGNAVKFTECGEVTACAEVRGGRLCLEVRDTGVGVPADQLARVFEPFVQVTAASTTTRTSGGTGLGLSIVRELARLMGGEVRARSEVGRGSVFTVELPAAGVH